MRGTRRKRSNKQVQVQVQIGILSSAMPLEHLNQAQSYLDKAYVSWIQMSGANAVIIPYNTDNLSTYLSSVHGVVLVGGGVWVTTPIDGKRTHSKEQYGTYMRAVQEIYDHAVRENDRGNHYPLWGTCLGFDMLAMMGENLHDGSYLHHIQDANKFRLGPLIFKGSSRLRSAIPKSLQTQMVDAPVVHHIHKHGFDMKSAHTKKLTKYLKIVSVDEADNGVEFVNMFEYKKYPFYGCQWHPEKPLTDLGVELGYTLSLFLRNECAKNNTRIPRWSKISESGPLTSKFTVVVKGGGFYLI